MLLKPSQHVNATAFDYKVTLLGQKCLNVALKVRAVVNPSWGFAKCICRSYPKQFVGSSLGLLKPVCGQRLARGVCF